MKIIKFCKRFFLNHKKCYFEYLSLILVSWIVSITIPYLSGKYIDLLVSIKDKLDIYFYTKAILVIGVIGCFSSYFKSIVYEKIYSRSVNGINLYLIEHIRKLPLSFFRNTNSVYLVQRIRMDSSELIYFSISEVINLIIKIFTCLTSFVIMFKLNYKVASILLIVIPIYIVIYKLFGQRLYSCRHNYIEKDNSYVASLNQQINNIQFIKLNSLYSYMNTKIRVIFEDFFSYIMKLIRVNSLYENISDCVDSIANVILFLYGGLEIYNGNLTVGEFTIMNLYFNMAFASIQYFVKFGGIYQRVLVSYNRVIEILQIPNENNGTIVLNQINNIKLENIEFSYSEKQKIIANFNYYFEKGKIYCLKGLNGSGKSTLIKLMLGIEQNYKGNILFDGVKLEDIDMYELRNNKIGITEQEPTLLNDTLRSNLILNNNKLIKDEKIINYCNELGLNSLTKNFSNGLDTILDENNTNISGGEKQKISIIKTLLKDPDVLILDEPTSALDENSIKKLENILLSLKKNKIIIIISHNDSILDFANNVIDINRDVFTNI
ncbi:ABC transporter ATP-binding protein [Oceanirhabdus sp. W0125-5]|uniref:ABC transporter ATP-binding protein n=1 Tax=Oceanirhabdus sp. W0125-5 TaxID=2999116 RepID=UPI0022F2BF26|nr:ABC transporter ATP-binding protein [Oceanirhabdus sp. W0125-5]WBW95071.1 ABC transporter ATP-binding protein [Oceanirhabdus sp. W0125-5]